jgi:carboxylate-amine ligase
LQTSAAPTAEGLRARFDEPAPLTVGVEEEVMVLDPATGDLAPVALEVLAALGGDERFKPELPAAQLEIVAPPAAAVGEAALALLAARRALVEAAPRLRFAGAGAHPFATPEGTLNGGERYEAIAAEYGLVARRQLVFGLHVHVALRGAERALAVYNALRSHLPELAALAANAPFHAGGDTGLASVRPVLMDPLPRQGVPPELPSWEAYADALRWGARTGWVAEPRQWWYELRPHPGYGTLEVRVADQQTTVGETGTLAAVVHALVAHLAARHDAGEDLPVIPSWRIEQNRWSACRHGLDGPLADLATGELLPARERLGGLLDDLAPVAAGLACGSELARARDMVQGGAAARQRAVVAERGLPGLVDWLAARFLDGCEVSPMAPIASSR